MSVDGLPPIDQALLPADVRNGTKADRDRYTAALGFERMLVQQLTQRLADTTSTGNSSGGDSGDGSDSGASASTNAYKQMLPGALADAVTASGGLGLARQIAGAMKVEGQGA